MTDPQADALTLPALAVAWVREILPEIETGYDYTPTEKLGALPDIVVELQHQEDALTHPDFPFAQLQGVHIRVWQLEGSIMADNSDPATAAANLRRYASALAASLVADGTLGGRVRFASPLMTWDFTHPFVQYEDGTKGREATFTLTVGDLVEDPAT